MSDYSLDDSKGKEFLYWLRKRIENVYKDNDSEILSKLDKIIYDTTIVPNTIPPSTIDFICAKYFNNFHQDHNFVVDLFGEVKENHINEQIRSFIINMIANIFRSSKNKSLA
jgi:hypothetical protein